MCASTQTHEATVVQLLQADRSTLHILCLAPLQTHIPLRNVSFLSRMQTNSNHSGANQQNQAILDSIALQTAANPPRI